MRKLKLKLKTHSHQGLQNKDEKIAIHPDHIAVSCTRIFSKGIYVVLLTSCSTLYDDCSIYHKSKIGQNCNCMGRHGCIALCQKLIDINIQLSLEKTNENPKSKNRPVSY